MSRFGAWFEGLNPSPWKRWRTVRLPWVGDVRLMIRPWQQNAVIVAVMIGMVAGIIVLSPGFDMPPVAWNPRLADYGAGVVVLDPGVKP